MVRLLNSLVRRFCFAKARAPALTSKQKKWCDAGFAGYGTIVASNKLWCDAFASQKLGHLHSRANKKNGATPALLWCDANLLRKLATHHVSEKNKKSELFCFSRETWCPEQDLNLHTLRHMLLRHTCIPISPLGRVFILY